MDWFAKHWELETTGKDPIEAVETVIKKFKEQSEIGWWVKSAKARVTDISTMALDLTGEKWMGRLVFDLEFFEKRVV